MSIVSLAPVAPQPRRNKGQSLYDFFLTSININTVMVSLWQRKTVFASSTFFEWHTPLWAGRLAPAIISVNLMLENGISAGEEWITIFHVCLAPGGQACHEAVTFFTVFWPHVFTHTTNQITLTGFLQWPVCYLSLSTFWAELATWSEGRWSNDHFGDFGWSPRGSTQISSFPDPITHLASGVPHLQPLQLQGYATPLCYATPLGRGQGSICWSLRVLIWQLTTLVCVQKLDDCMHSAIF